jgi:TadE-like protein
MLEFALIVPLLLILLLGTADLGMKFNARQNLEEGLRDAARSAAVYDLGDDSSCQLNGGSPPNSPTNQLVCLVKDRVGLNPSDTRVAVVLGAGGGVAGEPILICAQYDGGPMTGAVPFMGSSLVAARSVMRLETDTELLPYAETAIEDWSACRF